MSHAFSHFYVFSEVANNLILGDFAVKNIYGHIFNVRVNKYGGYSKMKSIHQVVKKQVLLSIVFVLTILLSTVEIYAIQNSHKEGKAGVPRMLNGPVPSSSAATKLSHLEKMKMLNDEAVSAGNGISQEQRLKNINIYLSNLDTKELL